MRNWRITFLSSDTRTKNFLNFVHNLSQGQFIIALLIEIKIPLLRVNRRKFFPSFYSAFMLAPNFISNSNKLKPVFLTSFKQWSKRSSDSSVYYFTWPDAMLLQESSATSPTVIIGFCYPYFLQRLNYRQISLFFFISLTVHLDITKINL